MRSLFAEWKSADSGNREHPSRSQEPAALGWGGWAIPVIGREGCHGTDAGQGVTMTLSNVLVQRVPLTWLQTSRPI